MCVWTAKLRKRARTWECHPRRACQKTATSLILTIGTISRPWSKNPACTDQNARSISMICFTGTIWTRGRYSAHHSKKRRVRATSLNTALRSSTHAIPRRSRCPIWGGRLQGGIWPSSASCPTSPLLSRSTYLCFF